MNRLIDDCFLSELKTKVKSVKKDKDYYWHAFEDTIFFLGNEIMSKDIGMINNLLVEEVKLEGGECWHLLPEKLAGNVFMSLNFHERLRKCQMHTAQHVISAIIKNVYKAQELEAGLIEDCGFIEFDLKECSNKMMHELQVLCNGLIRDDINIKVEYPSIKEAVKYHALPGGEKTPLRVIHIGTLASICCECMHVPSLRYLQMLFIQGFIKSNNGYRIYFTCGDQLLDNIQKRYALLDNICSKLETPHMYLETGINAIINKLDASQAEITQWINHYIDAVILPNKPQKSGDLKIGVIKVPACGFSRINEINSRVLVHYDVLLLYNHSKKHINVLLSMRDGTDFDLNEKWLIIKNELKLRDIVDELSASGTCSYSAEKIEALEAITANW